MNKSVGVLMSFSLQRVASAKQRNEKGNITGFFNES